MNPLLVHQGSLEWFEARCGRVTASRIADMMAKTQKGWAASRYNYLGQLIAERLTGQVQDSFMSKPMIWGTVTEPDARDAYEFFSGLDVSPVGFIPHPVIEMAGASPDSLVGDKGCLEIKCPNTSTHIDTLLGNIVPEKYVLQMQFQMACANREWCDFVSFDPRMPEDLKLFVRRVERDDHCIQRIEEATIDFLAEVDAKVAAVTSLRLALPEREMAHVV